MKFYRIILFLLFGLLLMSEECSESNKPIENPIIYPNPATDVIDLKFEIIEDCELTITIYDISGNKLIDLINKEICYSGQFNKTMDVHNFNNGVYLCKIEGQYFTDTVKFAIKR